MSKIMSVVAAAVFAIATSVLGVSHFGGQASPAVEPTASANQNVVENQIVVVRSSRPKSKESTPLELRFTTWSLS